jgi:hypothetical protein
MAPKKSNKKKEVKEKCPPIVTRTKSTGSYTSDQFEKAYGEVPHIRCRTAPDIVKREPLIGKIDWSDTKRAVDGRLMGFARRTRRGGAIKLSIHRDSFLSANAYKSKTGDDYVELIINLSSLRQVLSGEKEVTSVVQLVNLPINTGPVKQGRRN